MTRYVFIGAGAIGSAVGGLLAARGTDVLMVARGDHGRAMAAGGLRLRTPEETVSVRPPTVTGPDGVVLRPDDVLVLTTKTHQAEAAIDQWADVEVHDGDTVRGRAADLLPIITALNGVASEEIALRYFARVYAACVMMPAAMIDPGEVILRGTPQRGVFHLGRYPTLPADDPDRREADARWLSGLAADWDAAGCHVTTPDAVMDWKYRKLLSNLGNVFDALLADPGEAGDLRRAAEAEARRILDAAGIGYISDETDNAARRPHFSVAKVPGTPDRIGGSSWQSLMRGTGTIETDYLNGEIALIARRTGDAAPLNARLTALARRAARNGLRPGAITIDRLTDELRDALPGTSLPGTSLPEPV
ncbi:ketopantoate reductase family protein [Microlunatus soli]|uniref:2-dehydropantoate 2-reductase n=1 Tax=Microlunatus soli TaxID=630515 RepID=A0A1H1S3S2_9ACTN|nr:2-dehydropantoate 2-reductase N-terminal domain-containing protein [Microlunatus soli]SDS42740.1 2-dehydropantoate 2-reductase [Microlunatus soli]